jgi:hypothetical protein
LAALRTAAVAVVPRSQPDPTPLAECRALLLLAVHSHTAEIDLMENRNEL